MRQSTTAAAAKTAGRSKPRTVPTKPAKIGARRPRQKESTRNENDPAADFVIGALLYSLFASHRSEMISGLLPDDEK